MSLLVDLSYISQSISTTTPSYTRLVDALQTLTVSSVLTTSASSGILTATTADAKGSFLDSLVVQTLTFETGSSSVASASATASSTAVLGASSAETKGLKVKVLLLTMLFVSFTAAV